MSYGPGTGLAAVASEVQLGAVVRPASPSPFPYTTLFRSKAGFASPYSRALSSAVTVNSAFVKVGRPCTCLNSNYRCAPSADVISYEPGTGLAAVASEVQLGAVVRSVSPSPFFQPVVTCVK